MICPLLGLTLADPQVISAPLRLARHDLEQSFEKRSVTDLTLYNANHYYVLDFGLGTPPQSVEWLMDTSSGDFWVLSSNATICGLLECHRGSTFDATKSSTFTSNNTEFYQLYSDMSTANGTWAQDTLSFGPNSVKNFNFAVANVSNTNITVGGIGLGVTESVYLLGETGEPYQNFPIQLKQQGLIAYAAYSLFLNDLASAQGSVLFGGVNRSHLLGSLYRFPLVPTSGIDTGVDNFALRLSSLFLITSDGIHNRFADAAMAVTFDSSTSVSRLPTDMLAPMLRALNAFVENGMMVVDCKVLQNGGGVGLLFNGIEFSFSFHDIAVRVNKHHCIPGFLTGDPPVIGNNLLRSLYVVYDLEQLELGLARVNTSGNKDEVVELSTGIPGIMAPKYNETDIDEDFTTYSVQFSAMPSSLTTTVNSVVSTVDYLSTTNIVSGSHHHIAPSVFNETTRNGGHQQTPHWLALVMAFL